mgnify:CR=1 FL=1
MQQFQRTTVDTTDHTGMPHIESITIGGPFEPSGPGDTPSRRLIFLCRPTSASAEEPVRAQDPFRRWRVGPTAGRPHQRAGAP